MACVVQTCWGMTELSPLGTDSPATATVGKPRQVGSSAHRCRPAGDRCRWRALPVQRGQEGRLWSREPAWLSATSAIDDRLLDAEGWFDTGDLAVIDDDGNLTHHRPGEGSDQVGRRMDQSRPRSRLSSARCPRSRWSRCRPRRTPNGASARCSSSSRDEPSPMNGCSLRCDGRVPPTGGSPTRSCASTACRSPMTGKIDKRVLRERFG